MFHFNFSFEPWYKNDYFVTAPGKVESFNVTQDPNITAKTNVRIQWKPPIERDLNGIIQKYFILYRYQRGRNKVKLID